MSVWKPLAPLCRRPRVVFVSRSLCTEPYNRSTSVGTLVVTVVPSLRSNLSLCSDLVVSVSPPVI